MDNATSVTINRKKYTITYTNVVNVPSYGLHYKIWHLMSGKTMRTLTLGADGRYMINNPTVVYSPTYEVVQHLEVNKSALMLNISG